jgi:hypothetical protein
VSDGVFYWLLRITAMQSASRRYAARSSWKLSGTKAEFAADELSGCIEVTKPHLGVQRLSVAGHEVPGPQLALSVGAWDSASDHTSVWEPHEAYARGDDLVATYREPSGEPFNLQLYWRHRRGLPRALATIDVIASIHTPLWEAYPEIVLRTTAGEMIRHSAQWRIERIGDLYRMEATRAGDFAYVDEGPCPRWRFGGVFMERGVIRKLHLRTTWLHSTPDESAITTLLQLFGDDLPLTA